MSQDMDSVSREILDILYSNRSTSVWESGEVSRDTLHDALSYEPNQIDKCIKNLGARTYIKIISSMWSDNWVSAVITTKGIEYYESQEDKLEFDMEHLSSELLDILNAQFERNQDSIFGSDEVSLDKLYDVLNYRARHIDRALKNLEAKGLIELSTSAWSGEVTGAEISQKGIDSFESGIGATDKVQPELSPQTIHIHGDVHGAVSQTSGGDTYNITTIYEGINVVRAYLESNDDIGEDIKVEALEHLDIIEKEVESDEPDKDVLSHSWGWLKRNTPRFVEAILSKVIAGLLLRAI